MNIQKFNRYVVTALKHRKEGCSVCWQWTSITHQRLSKVKLMSPRIIHTTAGKLWSIFKAISWNKGIKGKKPVCELVLIDVYHKGQTEVLSYDLNQFLAHLAIRPSELLPSLCVRCCPSSSSINIFKHQLWNYSIDCNQTLPKCSLGYF